MMAAHKIGPSKLTPKYLSSHDVPEPAFHDFVSLATGLERSGGRRPTTPKTSPLQSSADSDPFNHFWYTFGTERHSVASRQAFLP